MYRANGKHDHTLTIACWPLISGNAEVLQLLLDKGANVEAPTPTGTPLLWAAGCADPACVQLLLSRGANPNVVARSGITAILMAAAAGARPNWLVPFMHSVYHAICIICRSWPFCVAQLIPRRVAEVCSSCSAYQETVSMPPFSRYTGSTEAVRALLAGGANVNAPAEGGATALHVVAELEDEELMQTLLDVTRWDVPVLLFLLSMPNTAPFSPDVSCDCHEPVSLPPDSSST